MGYLQLQRAQNFLMKKQPKVRFLQLNLNWLKNQQ